MSKRPIDTLLDQVDWQVLDTAPGAVVGEHPYATHTGIFHLAGISLRVYQLNTGERIIDAEDVAKILGVFAPILGIAAPEAGPAGGEGK